MEQNTVRLQMKVASGFAGEAATISKKSARRRVQCRLHDATDLENVGANDVMLDESTEFLRINDVFGAIVVAINAAKIAIIIWIESSPPNLLTASEPLTFFDIVNVELAISQARLNCYWLYGNEVPRAFHFDAYGDQCFIWQRLNESHVK